MAKTVTPLNNTQVKHAKPKEKEYTLSDGGGLQLRVRTNGSRLWIFKYTHPITKKRTNLGLGRYPSVSLADAREKRSDARIMLAKQIDPKIYREIQLQQQKEDLENTFGVLAEKWLVLKKEQVKPETAEKSFQSLTKHILPSLQNVPINSIKPKLIIDILEPVKNEGSLETVKRLCRIINEIMRIAVASGVIEVNYLADITKLFPAPKKTNMPTLAPSQLPELMQSLHNANITKLTRCLIEWQLHTMTSPIEAVTVRWEDIDLDKNVWIIPAERMKMKRPHTIPLTPQSLSLLNVLKPISGHRELLFPGHRDPRTHANSQTW